VSWRNRCLLIPRLVGGSGATNGCGLVEAMSAGKPADLLVVFTGGLWRRALSPHRTGRITARATAPLWGLPLSLNGGSILRFSIGSD
jgi:hypothetical protein